MGPIHARGAATSSHRASFHVSELRPGNGDDNYARDACRALVRLTNAKSYRIHLCKCKVVSSLKGWYRGVESPASLAFGGPKSLRRQNGLSSGHLPNAEAVRVSHLPLHEVTS